MNKKKWSVGSLIPGQETMFIPENKLAVPSFKPEKKEEPAPAASAVRIQQGGLACSVPVKPGSTLLDAALANGCDVKYKCRKGTCGQCAVDVVAGAEFLSARNTAEQKKLGSSAKRLACQSIMSQVK